MDPFFSTLVSQENKALNGFFQRPIDVPSIPSQITKDLYEFWKTHKFDLHFLPYFSAAAKTKVAKWKTKIARRPGFFEELFGTRDRGMNLLREAEELHLYSDALTLPGQWVLVDSRQKPRWNEGRQAYPEDSLTGGVLAKLRADQELPQHSHAQESRFDLSWEDLSHEGVRRAMAAALRVDSLRLPHAIEWNMIANLWYSHWGDTDTDEWFEDEYRPGSHSKNGVHKLYGGDSRDGGIGYVNAAPAIERDSRRGFRFLSIF